MGKLKQILLEGSSSYNADEERKETLQLVKEAIVKLKNIDKLIQSTHSVNAAYYMGLSGDIKRLHTLMEHILDLTEKHKDDKGERF